MKSVRKKGMRAARFSIKKVAGLSIKEFKNTKEAKDAVEKTKDAAKKTKEAVKMAAKEAAKQAAKAPGAKDAAKEAKDAAKKAKKAKGVAYKQGWAAKADDVYKQGWAAIAAKEDDAYKKGWADCMAAPVKEDDAYKQGWADCTAAAMPKTPDIPVASKDSCHAAHQYLDGLECVKKHCCGSTLWSCSCCGRTSPRQCWWSNKIPEYWTAV
jgi:hypothetical protein